MWLCGARAVRRSVRGRLARVSRCGAAACLTACFGCDPLPPIRILNTQHTQQSQTKYMCSGTGNDKSIRYLTVKSDSSQYQRTVVASPPQGPRRPSGKTEVKHERSKDTPRLPSTPPSNASIVPQPRPCARTHATHGTTVTTVVTTRSEEESLGEDTCDATLEP